MFFLNKCFQILNNNYIINNKKYYNKNVWELLKKQESFIYFCVGSQSQITNNYLRKTSSNILR